MKSIEKEARKERQRKLRLFKKEIREEREDKNLIDKRGQIYHINKHGMVVRGAAETDD